MTDLFPPFDPGDEPRRRRFKGVPLRVLLPNLVTLLSLCAGLTAMRLAIEGGNEKLDRAVLFILAAAVLDGLDGRLARLLKGTSRFGAELDSLADFVSFGVAPAMVLYIFGLHEITLHRLDRGAGVRHGLRAAPRAVQRHVGRPVPA